MRVARMAGPLLVAASLVLGGCAPQAGRGGASGAASAPVAPTGAAAIAPAPAGSAPTGGAASAPSSAAPAAQRPSPLSPPVTVRAATTPSISNGGRYIAMERGYFEEEGIRVEDVPSDTSAQLLPSLAAGQIDLLSGGTASGIFNAIAQGIPLRIVLDQWSGFPGNEAGGLMMRKDLIDSGRVREPADLRGLRLAMTAKGHNTEIVLSNVLGWGGLTFADVETVTMPYPDMNIALANHNIDGGVSIEPYAAQGVNDGYSVRWKPWSEAVPYDEIAVVMYSQAFGETQNEAAKRYAKAYVRGLRDYNDARTKGKDRDEIIGYFQKHTPLKDRGVYDWMPWPSNDPNGHVRADTIAAAQDWFYDHGYVPTKVDLSKVIDNQFADYAVQQLGPYQP
ncbi:MAG TPA: ABC transporter substrate-binding protein [Chloroflexota bacterium]|nr:ABC transporter substrate-binding protein [Chloroflexota bacterium]